ncbi:MAG: hypothetical protein AB7S38_24730 [Vulcanimicrobiota bacterium]
MSPPPPIGWSSPSDLELRYTGQLKADLDRLPRLATLIKQERARREDLVLLDTGDFSAGHAISDQHAGKPVAEVMNHLDYDAAVLGRGDCQWGVAGLRQLERTAGFPFLAANWQGFQGFVDLNRSGVSLRVVGLAWPEPPQGVEAIEPKLALARALEGSSDDQVVVVLSQLGYQQDRQLALGHELHVLLEGVPYDGFSQVTTVSETLLVPACSGAGHLGSLRLELAGGVGDEERNG